MSRQGSYPYSGDESCLVSVPLSDMLFTCLCHTNDHFTLPGHFHFFKRIYVSYDRKGVFDWVTLLNMVISFVPSGDIYIYLYLTLFDIERLLFQVGTELGLPKHNCQCTRCGKTFM